MAGLLADPDTQLAVTTIIMAPFIGSFLGLIAERVPIGREVVFSRSECDTCNHQLSALDLMPIVSWVIQRGRCRYCKTPVDIAYPLIEIGALVVAVTAILHFSGWIFVISCGFGWALLTAAIMDARYSVMSDVVTLCLIPAGLFVTLVATPSSVLHSLLGAILGFVSLFALARAYASWRGFEGLGLGDAKLFAGAGAWVTWQGLPSVLLIAGVSALLVVGLRSLASVPVGRYEAIPFGPYLALGSWLVWLRGPLTLDDPLLGWFKLSVRSIAP